MLTKFAKYMGAAVCAAGLTATVAANDFYVDSTLDRRDDDAGDGICADSMGRCTLRAAIEEANAYPGPDTIHVPDGTYELTRDGANEDQARRGDLDILDDVTIIGESKLNTVIDGIEEDRVFHVLGAYLVEMSHLTVYNGRTPEDDGGKGLGDENEDCGGGILNEGGVLSLDDVNVEGNVATDGGGICNAEGSISFVDSDLSSNVSSNDGGGMYTTGVVIMEDSTVRDNEASVDDPLLGGAGDGGGIYLEWGVLALVNTQVSINEADDGGGIYAESGYVELNGCEVSYNDANSSDGGGVYCDEASLYAESTHFLANYASSDGGGAYSEEGGFMDLVDCLFEINDADYGGAFYTYETITSASGCDFLDNFADEGGAFYSDYPIVTAIECLFEANIADSSCGGAAYVCEGGFEAYDCVFDRNAASSDGGVTYHSSSTGFYQDCEFTGNDALDGDGGVFYLSGYSLTVDNCVFDSNTSYDGGGVVYTSSYYFSATNCEFTNNVSAFCDGGAIYNCVGAEVIGCLFYENSTPDGSGGAIYNYDDSMYVGDCLFIDNSAGEDGGAIYHSEYSMDIVRCEFRGNAAQDDGGAIYLCDYGLAGTECTFDDNTARNGGAVYIHDGSPNFFRCTFSNNDAGDEGGAISNDGGEMNAINCTISGNSAFRGGGLYAADPCLLLNCTIAFNTTTSLYGIRLWNPSPQSLTAGGGAGPDPDGGGIFNDGGTVVLQNTILAENEDVNCGGDPVQSLGNNIDSDGTCELDGPGDQEVNPKLGPLQNNGGPTETHALLQGSPAIDAGNDDTAPATDQRGAPRPTDGDADGDAQSDVGAYEADGDEGTAGGAFADDCADAGLICPGQAVTGDNIGATGADGTFFCGSLFGALDVWIRYEPVADGVALVNVSGAPVKWIVGVYDGCPADGGEAIVCSAGGGVFPVIGGETYYLRVAGQGFAEGEFVMEIIGPPCN